MSMIRAGLAEVTKRAQADASRPVAPGVVARPMPGLNKERAKVIARDFLLAAVPMAAGTFVGSTGVRAINNAMASSGKPMPENLRKGIPLAMGVLGTSAFLLGHLRGKEMRRRIEEVPGPTSYAAT